MFEERKKVGLIEGTGRVVGSEEIRGDWQRDAIILILILFGIEFYLNVELMRAFSRAM